MSADPAPRVGLRTLKEAAQFLGVSQSTIYRAAEAGELELLKIGRRTRVPQESLDRYIRNAKRMVPVRSPTRGPQ